MAHKMVNGERVEIADEPVVNDTPSLERQIELAYEALTLEDWALAQPDDAGGTQAGRDAMAAKLAQINALKAQLAAL